MDIETCSLGDFSFLEAARQAPNQTALVVDGSAHSFHDLKPKVQEMIGYLKTLCLRPGDRVAILGINQLKTLILIYALIELKIPIVLLHPRLTLIERQNLIIDSGAAHFFGEEWSSAEKTFDFVEPISTTPADSELPLAILYTSGTSGQPKGAILSRRAFSVAVKASEANLGWKPEDRWLLCMPVAHIGGLMILLRCLAARRTVVLNEPQRGSLVSSFDPAHVFRQIESESITLISLVPTMLKRMLDYKPQWEPPVHLRAILLGGAAASPQLLIQAANLNLPVLTTYGLTEACSQVATETYGKIPLFPRGVGMPVAGMQVRLVENEIQIRGPSLLSGYIFNQRFVQPFVEGGWFPTGDMGYFDYQNQLHILNRRTDVIISGGENVYPSEIEHVLEQQPGVEAACVFGVPDDTWGQLVAAALITTPNLQIASLWSTLRNCLASYKLPRRIAFFEHFPTNAAGKIDRGKVINMATPKLQKFP